MRLLISSLLLATAVAACSKSDDKPTVDATAPGAPGASAKKADPGARVQGANGTVSTANGATKVQGANGTVAVDNKGTNVQGANGAVAVDNKGTTVQGANGTVTVKDGKVSVPGVGNIPVKLAVYAGPRCPYKPASWSSRARSWPWWVWVGAASRPLACVWRGGRG